MKFVESSTVELKSEYVEDIRKEIVAFANAQGGTVYIGVTDDGDVCGIDDYDAISNRISSMARDAIKPDLTRFIGYEQLSIEGKTVLKLQIHEGTHKPYYIAKNGLKPSGVYVRQGNESAQASDDAIRQMIKTSDGDSFEEYRSLNQDLTFDEARKEFEARSIEFDEAKEQTLGITDAQGLFTNLGLLLSDQSPYTVKCAVFDGTDQSRFVDRREFGGSIFKQMEDCHAFLDLNNPTSASFEGLYRTDSRDFPTQAVREALLNSLVHRDYSYSASVLIGIYSDRMEFLSVGGLLPGIKIQDVLMGLSICRNKGLADVFYRMRLIEAYGTGLRKIVGLYEEQPVKPEIVAGPNSFKIVLPRTLEKQNMNETVPVCSLDSGEQKICDLMERRGTVSRVEIDQTLEISQSTTSRLLRQMIEKGVVEKIGRGKASQYRLKK